MNKIDSLHPLIREEVRTLVAKANDTIVFTGLKKAFTQKKFLDLLGQVKLKTESLKLDEKKREKIEAYLGLDVGSISTNLVVIDREKRVLSKRYLMTAGRPIEAVRIGLQEIGEEIGGQVEIKGVGTTGSGRYLTADFVGADLVRNEITAQATAAVQIDSSVDTIFEIGGQDSKYISLDNGVVVDFEMNKVCAAGTGSFLEEQAEKLDVSIKGEFGALALSANEPVRMGERCTVFIESDLVHHQQSGAQKDDLIAGLSYSIVQNYLNRVVGDRRVGNRIFFQGGTAFNKGVVAAFEKVLDKEIIVPENHDVTGAIGVALLALEERTWERSGFKGFDLSQRRYEQTSFECKGCPNLCLIRKVSVEGEKPLFYGSRCEKYDVIKRTKGSAIPDLFEEREKMLFAPYEGEEKLSATEERGLFRIAADGMKDYAPLLEGTQLPKGELEIESYSKDDYYNKVLKLSEGFSDKRLTEIYVGKWL
jgi:predicted CoA-substrate-specific enzyme activase